MQQERFFNRFAGSQPVELRSASASRKTVIGLILVVALVAFEIFNFDTTRYALNNLLGEVAFFGVTWASILAIAFCAIDFAGLARLFTPERGADEPKAVWYLMGAWLLGATMNAIMTWWAVSLTLLNHDFGNEVLGRETLLTMVPIFVAALVLLTRILFIGAFSVAGEHLFDIAGDAQATARPQPAREKPVAAPQPQPQRATAQAAPRRAPEITPVEDEPAAPIPTATRRTPTGRPYESPSLPSGVHRMPAPMAAQGKTHR